MAGTAKRGNAADGQQPLQDADANQPGGETAGMERKRACTTSPRGGRVTVTVTQPSDSPAPLLSDGRLLPGEMYVPKQTFKMLFPEGAVPGGILRGPPQQQRQEAIPIGHHEPQVASPTGDAACMFAKVPLPPPPLPPQITRQWTTKQKCYVRRTTMSWKKEGKWQQCNHY